MSTENSSPGERFSAPGAESNDRGKPLCATPVGIWQDSTVISLHRTDKARGTEWTIVYIGGAHVTVQGRRLYCYTEVRRLFAQTYPGRELAQGSATMWRAMLAAHLQLDGGSDA
jgi:hypothetical protein